MEAKKSKITGFLIRFLGLVLVASVLFTSQAVLAVGSSTSSIDETFDVTKHLTTEGQENSKFGLGKKASLGADEAGPLPEGEAQRVPFVHAYDDSHWPLCPHITSPHWPLLFKRAPHQ